MSIDEFLSIVRSECSLELTTDDLHVGFDELAGWDSLHLLKLMSALEATTGRRLSAASVFRSRNLAEVHEILKDVT